MTFPRNSQLLRTISLIITICLVNISAQGQTTQYIFLPDQSTLVQTGGIGGVQWTYTVEGEFLLTVDYQAGTASFTQVDANAIDDSPFPRTLDPNEVFNMTALTGIIFDEGESIRFKGSTDDESSILITLTFADDTVKIKGQTTPPSDSSDFFIFTIDAVAQCADPCPADYPESSEFEFDTDRSTTTRTGGLAGVIKVYMVEGRFRLLVDNDAGTASFDSVDANLVDPEGLSESRSIDEYLNLSGLAGLVQADGSILFKGNVNGGSDVGITLTCENGCVHLVGETIPPPDSADFPIYHLDAIACRKYAGGTGEPNDPYQIATAADMIALGETPEDYNKHFILTADIDLDPNLPGGKVFDKALIAPDTDPNDDWSEFQGTPFSGVFYGDGHTISYLTVKGMSYLGLFGQLQGAEIRNLGVANVEITGSGACIGGLVGFKYAGNITASFSTGTISGDSNVGGLVGVNLGICNPGHSIVGSYSSGSVSGTGTVGGLVGWNTGSISSSYSVGAVSGTYYLGGLVGSSEGGTRYCAGRVDSSFWDIQVSGQATSAGGTGKTTAEMQMAKTFLDDGWDFVDETINGTDDIWWIVEGKDYPRLWWETK